MPIMFTLLQRCLHCPDESEDLPDESELDYGDDEEEMQQ